MNYSESSFILFSFSLRFNFLVGFEIFYQVFSQLESTLREFCASCRKFSLRFENFSNPSDALCWIQFISMKSKLRRGCWHKSVQLQLKHSLKFILDTVVSFFFEGNFSTRSFVSVFHDKFESSADFFWETVPHRKSRNKTFKLFICFLLPRNCKFKVSGMMLHFKFKTVIKDDEFPRSYGALRFTSFWAFESPWKKFSYFDNKISKIKLLSHYSESWELHEGKALDSIWM